MQTTRDVASLRCLRLPKSVDQKPSRTSPLRTFIREQGTAGSPKMPVHTDSVRSAYNSVLDDRNTTNWALFTHDDGHLKTASVGDDFATLKKTLEGHARAFVYLRIQLGDETSKRSKFVFIAWLTEGVGVIQRARMSSEKAELKEIITNFSVELLIEDPAELTEDHIKDTVRKAASADYGTSS